MKKLIAWSLWFIVARVYVSAQENPGWLRYPAISPDGKTIVFTYKGDLYRVPSSGIPNYPTCSAESDGPEPYTDVAISAAFFRLFRAPRYFARIPGARGLAPGYSLIAPTGLHAVFNRATIRKLSARGATEISPGRVCEPGVLGVKKQAPS